MEGPAPVVNTIANARLNNQRITRAGKRSPADVVAWLGAVQAQEYAAASWGLGLRMKDGTSEDTLDRALATGDILRTHVLRPTWHFVTPADIRWMLELTRAHVHRRMQTYHRQMGLDAATFSRGAALIERALGDRRCLTRAEIGEELRRAGLALDRIRLSHLAMYAELEGVICSGPRRGKQFTYALLEEHASNGPRLSRDESLAELCRRYFTSHAPATLRDFAWWSGLTMADARRGVEMIKARKEQIDGLTYWTAGRSHSATTTPRSIVHLLPIYDEYLVAYRDRDAVPYGPTVVKSGSGGYASFFHAIVIGGQVAGTWRVVTGTSEAFLKVASLRRLTRHERGAIEEAAKRYARFRGLKVMAVRF
jgi:hypothetical protein